jgi:uncharacterized protein (TIGR02145 family)
MKKLPAVFNILLICVSGVFAQKPFIATSTVATDVVAVVNEQEPTEQRTDGCNTNTPGWGESLGTVSFVTDQTWRVGLHTWSDVVQASNCNKTAFDGGLINNFNADCRSNPNNKGDFFSWCAIARFGNELCPEPWRVPTLDDFVALDRALGGNGSRRTNVRHRNRYLTNWGGTYGGRALSDGALLNQGTWGIYWSQSENNAGSGFRLNFATDGYVGPRGWDNKNRGFAVRCVR